LNGDTKKVNLWEYMMDFTCKQHPKERANDLWESMAKMFIGPEAEHVYMKRIIARFDFQYEKKE